MSYAADHKYERDDSDGPTSKVSGKVTKIKLNQSYESSSGKEFNAHLLVIEDSDQETHKFKVGTKSPAAAYIKKLSVGDKVEVKTGGKFNSVLAVFSANSSKGSGTGRYERKLFDSTGPIQGMVLNAAIKLAISQAEGKQVTAEEIIEMAKVVLAAKLKTDNMVKQALQPKDKEESDEEDEVSAERDEDEDGDEVPRKKRKSPY